MAAPKLVPELYVSDIDRSRCFYTGVLGFAVVYDRPEERFAYLMREGAALMLEQPADPGRTWLAGPLEPPYGRGINLQIEVADLGSLHRRGAGGGGAATAAAGGALVRPRRCAARPAPVRGPGPGRLSAALLPGSRVAAPAAGRGG